VIELRPPDPPLSDGVVALRACPRPPRAVRLLAAHAFETLGLHRIEIVPYAANPASQRVAENAGATREGVLRSYFVARGTRHDCVMYSLLPGDPRPGAEAP
jgi:RimJ/RimL family protein N-acetyltransferase